jgi:uncharacterized Zn-binding protein involved in type VI secretion
MAVVLRTIPTQACQGGSVKHNGKGVIRLGDQTTHGGRVVSATSGAVVSGKPAALAGDMTSCPRCKGMYPITSGNSGNRHQGRQYAYDGDTTACGAKLVSSA